MFFLLFFVKVPWTIQPCTEEKASGRKAFMRADPAALVLALVALQSPSLLGVVEEGI